MIYDPVNLEALARINLYQNTDRHCCKSIKDFSRFATSHEYIHGLVIQ